MKKIICCVLLFASIQSFAGENAKSQDAEVYKNNLQWTVTQMMRGAFAFTYERQLSNKVGVQIGLGATHEDYVFPFISDADYSGYDDEYQGGLYSSISLKIYPRGMKNFKGVYASPFFRYAKYSFSSSVTDIQGLVTTQKDLDRTRLAKDLGFTIGYQTGGAIMFNFYVGMCYSMQNYDKVVDTASGLDIVNELESDSKMAPTPVGGISVGFAF